MLLMPGSHQYDAGWLTEPPVVTRSSSRSHYQVVLLANEFVSNHVICKCLTQLWVKHATVLPTGTEIKRLSGISFFISAIHTLCGWFGSLFQMHVTGILIGTVLKHLSDENHLGLFSLFIYSPFKAAKATVVNYKFSPSTKLIVSFT